MAIKNRTLGENAFVYLGTILIGCAKTIEITTAVTENDVSCQGTGDVMQSLPGRLKHTWSITGLDRMATGADAATNKTVDDFFRGVVAKTALTIKYGSSTVGDIIKTGIGYAFNVKQSGSLDAPGTYDASGSFNSLIETTIA